MESQATYEQESETLDSPCDVDSGGVACGVFGHQLSAATCTTICTEAGLSTTSWRHRAVLHGQGCALDNQCYAADFPVFRVYGDLPKDEVGFHNRTNGILDNPAFLRAIL